MSRGRLRSPAFVLHHLLLLLAGLLLLLLGLLLRLLLGLLGLLGLMVVRRWVPAYA